MKLNRVVWCAVAILTMHGTVPSARANNQDAIIARLDALEKENAALRARLNRVERAGATYQRTVPRVASTQYPAEASGLDAHAQSMTPPVIYKSPAASFAPYRFEFSGSLLFLQPGAGNLEYGTLVTPLPLATPDWANQSLAPNFGAAFQIGARYMPDPANDIELNWTHQYSSTNGAFTAAPTQMVGPPYLIGPESGLYKIATGNVQFHYDSVNLDAGHTFCAECQFQLRAFGGVEFARLGQNVSGSFQSMDGTSASADTTHSLFNGAGPRLGLNGQYNWGDFHFIGEFAAAGLIGTSQNRIDFTTLSPALVGLNNQSLTSPNATQVIPSIDARLATAYTFAPGQYGQFKIEAGYRAAVYFNAVSQYALTQVPTSLMLPPVGVFLATQQHSQSNFTDQGPYVTGSWRF